MEKNFLLLLLLILVIVLFEFGQRSVWANTHKLVEGIVADVNDGSIKLMEKNTGNEMQIKLSPQTQFQGIQHSKDLAGGDKVTIGYDEESSENGKVATTVTKLYLPKKHRVGDYL